MIWLASDGLNDSHTHCTCGICCVKYWLWLVFHSRLSVGVIFYFMLLYTAFILNVSKTNTCTASSLSFRAAVIPNIPAGRSIWAKCTVYSRSNVEGCYVTAGSTWFEDESLHSAKWKSYGDTVPQLVRTEYVETVSHKLLWFLVGAWKQSDYICYI